MPEQIELRNIHTLCNICGFNGPGLCGCPPIELSHPMSQQIELSREVESACEELAISLSKKLLNTGEFIVLGNVADAISGLARAIIAQVREEMKPTFPTQGMIQAKAEWDAQRAADFNDPEVWRKEAMRRAGLSTTGEPNPNRENER